MYTAPVAPVTPEFEASFYKAFEAGPSSAGRRLETQAALAASQSLPIAGRA